LATIKKKTSSKKKTTKKKSAVANRKKKAADNRSALVTKLKKDLAATKVAMKAAQKGAREEINLAKRVAKAEVAVLKDQLNIALKQEKALRTMAEKKASAGKRNSLPKSRKWWGSKILRNTGINAGYFTQHSNEKTVPGLTGPF